VRVTWQLLRQSVQLVSWIIRYLKVIKHLHGYQYTRVRATATHIHLILKSNLTIIEFYFLSNCLLILWLLHKSQALFSVLLFVLLVFFKKKQTNKTKTQPKHTPNANFSVNLGLEFQSPKFEIKDTSVSIKRVKEAANLYCGVHLIQRASID